MIFHGEIRLMQTADDSKANWNCTAETIQKSRSLQAHKKRLCTFSVYLPFLTLQSKEDEDYPLIFDAATSSFGDSKEKEFCLH